MRYNQSEKMEVIKVVENSKLSAKRTLQELNINRSTFYNWYKRFLESGFDGLVDNYHPRKQTWNIIPPWERQNIVEVALEQPEKSPRELACYITDHYGYFVSESSVYRILKAHDLITSPAYMVLSARDKFLHPTTRINELWQTDFTYLKVIHWGWYYLSTVMDDYSRYIISWRLCRTMRSEDVKATLDEAIAKTGAKDVKVNFRTRLLSDNGSCYVSWALKEYLEEVGIRHIRGKPFHPMTQGKIERYHRTLKSLVLLDNYYSPSELQNEISRFVAYYNHYRYHEALDNVTPSDMYNGRRENILEKRKKIKSKSMKNRRQLYKAGKLDELGKKEYIKNNKTVS
jgi:transposase InsO family protein